MKKFETPIVEIEKIMFADVMTTSEPTEPNVCMYDITDLG